MRVVEFVQVPLVLVGPDIGQSDPGEPEISATLQEHLESLGVRVLTSATITKAGRAGERRWLDVSIEGTGERIEADQMVVATGRRADTTGLGLEAAEVETDSRGHVVVDDRLATTNLRVFAAGDVTTLPQFVYVAAPSGAIASEHALRGTSRRIDLHTMPRVTFTSPPPSPRSDSPRPKPERTATR